MGQKDVRKPEQPTQTPPVRWRTGCAQHALRLLQDILAALFPLIESTLAINGKEPERDALSEF